MKEGTVSDALLRRFLLGEVQDEERERIEGLFLVDPETKQRILIAEQDLIEEYVENSLTPADRERFLSTYAQTAEQRQKLGITKSIKKWASAQGDLPRHVSVKAERWSDLHRRLRWGPMVFVPIGATVAIAIIIAVAWLSSRPRQQRVAVEEELVRLNAPGSLREMRPQMVSVDLSPITVRGAERQITLSRGADVRVVELRLPSFQKERFSAYEAEVYRLGDGDSFTVRNLPAERDDRYATRIRLPVHILRPGQYELRLSGIPRNGITEQYQFTVTDS